MMYDFVSSFPETDSTHWRTRGKKESRLSYFYVAF